MTSTLESVKLKARIQSLLREKGNRVLSISDIYERLEADSADLTRDRVERAVEDLESEGVVLPVRGKRYSLLEFSNFVSGKIKVHPDGYGLLFGDGTSPDVHVERRSLRGAMNGDIVLVRVDKRGSRTKTIKQRSYLQGEVSRVLRREHRTVVGRFHGGDQPFVRPFDVRLDNDIEIDPAETMEAREGEMVNVIIDRYGDRSAETAGRVVEVLGMIGDPGVDIEVVVRKFSIPHRFPQEVLDEADSIPLEIDPREIAGRVDLRDRNIVTIDGETAKDFDDAIEVIALENGSYRLGVHIADVSHYVREGSLLDREAFERGTSVYFPGRAVPMLPERLSNGICSLNPQVDRLTFSAEIVIDAKGRFVDRKVFRSVIRTKERMTYTDVSALLSSPTAELRRRYEPLLADFDRMHALYEILRARRDARGSIDFDLPEADVLLTSLGEIEAIKPSERNVAHRLIEEFMLAANEVVAQQLFFAHQPGVYRVHSRPDEQKMADLKEILKEFKLKLRGNPEEIRPGELQRVLKEVVGRPEERFITEVILRSMKRALYLEECDGHFALGLLHYCHFTSPIRRYPDLIVHRMLGELIANGPLVGDRLAAVEAELPPMALQSSEREKRAEDAEREVMEWKKVIFMRDKVGMAFSGTVTGVVPFGLFVELHEFFVQGLVPVATIGGDFWNYVDRLHRLRGSESGREFRLGDQVKVEVRSIDEDRRQIEFRLLEVSGEIVQGRQPSQRSR